MDDTAGVTARIKDALRNTYLVERVLGIGGTAIVFLAEDLKHKRSVALKVLRPEIAGTIGGDRFTQEIRLAARLTHPHILPLLDSGEAAGLPYYVMPFVEGESLRGRLLASPRLAVSIAITLGREIADALDYAHAVGFVHRDIKPENVLLMGDHCVVADFGVSRAIRTAAEDSEFTALGITVGTPTYMSPEQAAGDATLDGRSDIYSTAVMLFEMLAGEPPFTGPTAQAIIGKRFRDVPPRLDSIRDDIPAHVCDAVAKALDIDPNNRFARAADFGRALSAERSGLSGVTAGVASWTLTPPAVAPRGAETANPPGPSIAVMAFENLSGDPANDYLCDGLAEEIMGSLSRIRQLRVAARMSSFAATASGHEDARTVGHRLKVGNILEGSVRRAGSRVRVSLRLVDAESGFQLWADRYDRELDDVFAMQDEIAHALAEALKIVLLGESHGSLIAPGTRNTAAHEAYLRGRFLWNKRTEDSLRQAAQEFRRAIALDPQFALAYSGLADTLAILGIYGALPPGEVMLLARQAAEQALQLDPTDASAWVCLGSVRATFDWDWDGAHDAFRRAISIAPWHAPAHHRFAIDYLAPRRRFAEAIAHLDRARTTDPLSSPIAATGGVVRYFARDYPGAVQAQRAVIARDERFPIAHYFLGTALREQGDTAAALSELGLATAMMGASPEVLAAVGQTHAKAGDMGAARLALHRLTSLATERYVAPSLVAKVHASLGDIDSALDCLEQACEVRDCDLIFAGLRPTFDSLAGEPRFARILRTVGTAAA